MVFPKFPTKIKLRISNIKVLSGYNFGRNED